jgi:hypothetical protein
VELVATVGHLISWLAASGSKVTNRLEPKRFKADMGERVGLIAAQDAAAGEAGRSGGPPSEQGSDCNGGREERVSVGGGSHGGSCAG